MVWTDPVSQDVEALRRLSDYHGSPVLAVHAPCLLITQRVWGTDPWAKLVARRRTPPSSSARRRSSCTRRFAGSATTRGDFVGRHRSGWPRRPTCASRSRTCSRCGPAAARCTPYAPDWDPHDEDFRALHPRPVAHGGVAVRRDGHGRARWATGSRTCTSPTASARARDEHLVPGRGTQPCAELLETLARVRSTARSSSRSTRAVPTTRADREADLAEALAFTRLNLAAPADADSAAWRRRPPSSA